MKLLITGSRYISSAGIAYARAAVQRAKDLGWTIVVGDAGGVDQAVMNECHRLGVKHEVWGAYGKYRRTTPSARRNVIAGDYLERDRAMVERADKCLAIWNGSSSGTKYTYDQAVAAGKEAWLRVSKS